SRPRPRSTRRKRRSPRATARRRARPGMSAVPAPRGAPDHVIDVANIEVSYNHVMLVLKGVSLSVPEGAIVALLGANGAGKSTTLKAISNLLRSERGEVTKGQIRCRGERTDGLTPNDLVRRGIIQVM